MLGFSDPYVGTEGGPPSTQAYKRAVYKQAPSNFTVEVLQPQKQGNNYNYGMRICPVRSGNDRRSMISGHSSGSSSSMSEYEVWRRWEDCLYFQDLLETQYAIMSREKRTRLAQGKGVKRNGVYPHEDPSGTHAASFESLPPGPDPHTIAKDVHDVLPRLTKKGTLFRASAATVEQRAQEFTALMDALWRDGEDVPTLLIELRDLRTVRDFFGHWRRDRDRLDKEKAARAKTESPAPASPSSRASSMFSTSSFGMYFSASNLSLQLPPNFPPPDAPKPTNGVRPPASRSAANGAGHTRQRSNTSQGIGGTAQAARVAAARATVTSLSSMDEHREARIHPRSERRLPASAPAGVTFTFTLNSSDEDPELDGYLSEAVSVDARPPPRSPRSALPPLSPTLSAAESDTFRGKGKGRAGRRGPEPIIVSQELEKMDIPVDSDENEQEMILREHEHLIPHTLDPLFETYEHDAYAHTHEIDFRIQNLTIDEEEGEGQDAVMGGQDFHSHQDAITPVEEEALPLPIPRTPRRNGFTDVPAENRNGLIFMSPTSTALQIDEDDVSSYEGHSSADQHSPSQSGHARAPQRQPLTHVDSAATISSANISATASNRGSTRSASPAPSRFFTPGSSSRRTSWASSMGHTVSSDGHASLNGAKRPASMHSHSSATSTADLDSRVPSSPIVLHTPLYEEFEEYDSPNLEELVRSRHRQHDSMSSFRSFMTDCSADAIIPRPPPSPTFRTTSLQRSFSNGSRRRNRHSQASSIVPSDMSESWAEQGDELLDSYFYGANSSTPATPSEEGHAAVTSPGREHVRGTLSRPDAFPKPFRNRPAGQFHLPWTPVASARSSVSSSAPPSAALENAVAIKVALGASIVAFRADPGISLGDVRERIRDKFVNEQGVPLSGAFSLGYKPAARGAKQAAGARARSSSVSSVGVVDPSQLRYIFSQVEWQEAMANCGAKLTLQVLDGAK